jgi:hypothetical protein
MTATLNNPSDHEPAAASADMPAEPELTPEDIAARRRFCTWLQYWRDCAMPACRRAHACTGDPTDCFFRRWMGLSEVGKVWVRAGTFALEYGLTARNAAGAADLALLHHVKEADRLPRHPPRRRRRRSIDGDAQWARPNCGNKA